MAPVGDSEPSVQEHSVQEPSVQEPEQRLDESTKSIFDEEIDIRLGHGNYHADTGSTPHFHHVEEPQASRNPYFAAQHGARVGDTSTTNNRNMAQFKIPDNRQAAGSSTTWPCQESPVASYTTSMGISPYSESVGSGPFTWSVPETTTPSSSSAPRGVAENQAHVQNNYTSWPVPSNLFLDPMAITENWHEQDYEYHGSGTWSDLNGNFD